MLLKELPEHISPEKICRAAPSQGTVMQGKIMLSKMSNLTEELRAQKLAFATVSLTFAVDKAGICSITGEMTVDLTLICQRCLQPMMQTITAVISVSPVSSDEQAKHLPARYEPLLVQNGEITFAEWIAEELHLALPLVPRHDPPCVSYGKNQELT